MKHLSMLSLLPALLVLVSCASNPQQQGESEKSPSSTAAAQPPPSRTIVPDINAAGHRGDLARAILAKSSTRFLEADENRDYRISLDEAEAHLPHLSREFPDYDKDGDGGITWQEYVRHDQWPAPVHGQ